MMKIFIFEIFLLSLLSVEGLRIRRSESEQSKDTVRDETIELKNSDQKNIKLLDDGLFYDDVSKMSHDQTEREAINFIPHEIPSKASQDGSEELLITSGSEPSSPSPYISYLYTTLTPSPLYNSPTPSPFYGSPTPTPFLGSPTPSLYPKLLPNHGLPFTPVYHSSLSPVNPYTSTVSPHDRYHPSPGSNFPFGYSKPSNYFSTPQSYNYPSSAYHTTSLPKPYHYSPSSPTRPAITFLDESPISQSIQIKHRSFTPQPRIKEPNSEDAAVPLYTPKSQPNNNGPPQLALLTIGLQSLKNDSEILPQDPEPILDTNINDTDITEHEDDIITGNQHEDEKLVIRHSTFNSTVKDTTTVKENDVIFNFPQNILEESSSTVPKGLELTPLNFASHPEEKLNNPVVSSKEEPNHLEKLDFAQLNISSHPEESLSIPLPILSSQQSKNEASKVTDDFNIFSDPTLSLESHQDVPRSPKSFETAKLSESKAPTSQPIVRPFPLLDQNDSRIIEDNNPGSDHKLVNPLLNSEKESIIKKILNVHQERVIQNLVSLSQRKNQSLFARPIRIKIPAVSSRDQLPSKDLLPLKTTKPLEITSTTSPFNNIHPETTTIVYALPFLPSIDIESENQNEEPKNDQHLQVFTEPATFPNAQQFNHSLEVDTFSADSERHNTPQPFSLEQSIQHSFSQAPLPLIPTPFQQSLNEIDHRNTVPQQHLENQRSLFEHEFQRPGFNVFAQQQPLHNLLPTFQHNLNTFNIPQTLQKITPAGQILRNPSDYIFVPQQPLVPTHFNIETRNPLPLFDVPAIPQTQHFSFNPQENFVNIIPPVVNQQPRQQKSFEPTIFDENTFESSDPQQNEIIQDVSDASPAQQTLFQSINQEAIDRPVRKKQSEASNLRTVPKSAALQRLVNIAGDDWDTSLHTGKSILGTSSTSFQCPSLEGDYPDTEKCSVYYQCAQGVAHQHTCQAGLHWNMVINMCDWEANVDCEINKGNRDVPLPSVAEVRQVVSQPFTMFGV